MEQEVAQNSRDTHYPQRQRSAPRFFFDPSSANVAVSGEEPRTVAEALSSDDENAWREAINSEMNSLLQHNT